MTKTFYLTAVSLQTGDDHSQEDLPGIKDKNHDRPEDAEVGLEEDPVLYPMGEALKRAVHKLDLESRFKNRTVAKFS